MAGNSNYYSLQYCLIRTLVLAGPLEKEKAGSIARKRPITAFEDALQNVTSHYCRSTVLSTLDTVTKNLTERGVDSKVINDAILSCKAELNRTLVETNKKCVSRIKSFGQKKYFEKLRTDYLGRALLFHIDDLFPKDEGARAIIAVREIEGMVPSQVAGGLVELIKNSFSSESVENHEDVFYDMVEDFRNPETKLVSLELMLKNPQIKSIVSVMMKQFEKQYLSLGEEEARMLVVDAIESSDSFAKMERNLSDREYLLIMDRIFDI